MSEMHQGRDLTETISKAALARWPEEACGVVIRKGRKTFALELPNSAANKKQFFLISPDDRESARRQGEIIGIWHTHAEAPAVFSMADMAGCELTDLPWYLMACNKRDDGLELSELLHRRPCGFMAPYVGRPYAFGALDCWTLAQDYYKREFGIELCHFPRIENFWKVGHDFMGEQWEKPGFVEMPRRTQPNVGDLFLFQTDDSGNPNHVAVYVGDGLILHHSRGRLSTEEPYEGYWQKHTVRHIRHKELLEKQWPPQ